MEETEEVEVEEEEVEETEEVDVDEEEVEETVEVDETEEEEEGVYEITIKGKSYYATNEINGTIYEMLPDEEIGRELGVFKNKVVVWNK